MDIERRKTKSVYVGSLGIGSDFPVSVQSMTNVHASYYDSLKKQVSSLVEAGVDVIRVSVPDEESVKGIYKLKHDFDVPFVADIHFDYKLALAAVDAGIDKLRINPGNIGDGDKIKAVADKCRLHNVPIRIGVNSGSAEKHLIAKYGGPTPKALCDSALYNARFLERYDFDNIVISVKASNVYDTVRATEEVAANCDYPLHLGVTEAGTAHIGILKASAALGALFTRGIGDTVRISLTDDPVNEVKAARDILKAIGIRKNGINVISCPTCSRTKVNLIGIVKDFEKALSMMGNKYENISVNVAIMGCAVNGPGEAKEADIGVACGSGEALLFANGQTIGKIDGDKICDTLLREIDERFLK